MSNYIFGKDIIRSFYVNERDEFINLPTQAPAIYIFTAMPSLENAKSGAGSIRTVTEWTQSNVKPYQSSYVITAIDDPEPNSSTTARHYYEAINFITKAAGQIQTCINSFEVQRATRVPEVPGLTRLDVKEVFPAISKYLNDSQIDDFILLAEDKLKIELASQGIDYFSVHNLQQVKLALGFSTVSYASLSLISTPGDRFDFRYEQFKKLYRETLSQVILGLDTNKDGMIDTSTTGKKSYGFLLR